MKGNLAMPRKDEQIKKDILEDLYWDPRIDASKIAVTVERGRVRLAGTVPMYADLAATRSAAWRIQGVMGVSDEALVVEHVPEAARPNDTELRARIENLLAWEPSIDETQLEIDVSNSVVTLGGTVDAHWKSSYAQQKAGGVGGVRDIDNKLVVVPSNRITDEMIARDVTEALDRDALVDLRKLSVTVNDGTVTLAGAVPGGAARRAAVHDASLTAGVVGVRNELTIAS